MYESIDWENEAWDAADLRSLVVTMTQGFEPQILPGPTRFSEVSAQAFNHLNPDGMFVLFMGVTRIYMRNRVARNLSSVIFNHRPSYNIKINDLVVPEESRAYCVPSEGERVIVIQDDQKPRTMNQQDVDVINGVMATLTRNM